MKYHILHIPQVEGIRVESQIVEGKLRAQFFYPPSSEQRGEQIVAAMPAPEHQQPPSRPALVIPEHSIRESLWNAPPRSFVAPEIVGNLHDVSAQCGLRVAAYLGQAAQGGMVGHIYLPNGISERSIYRPQQRFLCSSRKHLQMPKCIIPAERLTCRACNSLLRSISGKYDITAASAIKLSLDGSAYHSDKQNADMALVRNETDD